jgi:hypothetical protein
VDVKDGVVLPVIWPPPIAGGFVEVAVGVRVAGTGVPDGIMDDKAIAVD